MVLKAPAFLPLLVSVITAQNRVDYFVIADPREYTIYNQYEQPVSESEKADFVPYSPFQIIDNDAMLGDRITRALTFVFQQKKYYLLKEENGKFMGEKSKAGRQAFRGVEPCNDTIEVLGNGLTMVSGAGRNVAIEKGRRLIRVFRSGPRYYCAVFLDRTTYGWSSLEPRWAWRKIEGDVNAQNSVIKDTGLSESLQRRILARCAAANESYKTCFSHFNEQTGDERSVPQWHCECRGSRMFCRLGGPYADGNQLSESSKCLAQDIGNLLIGTNFRASCRDGAIVIEKRSGSD
jgi:hypothetical protein